MEEDDHWMIDDNHDKDYYKDDDDKENSNEEEKVDWQGCRRRRKICGMMYNYEKDSNVDQDKEVKID
jgi:hypothetical protein